MVQTKQKQETRLNELIGAAKLMSIEVRTEKLLREVGYRARSGRWRVGGKDMMFIKPDAGRSDKIDSMWNEIAQIQRPQKAATK
jgi:hypothetical protein